MVRPVGNIHSQPGPKAAEDNEAPEGGGWGAARYLPGSIPTGAKSRALEELGALSVNLPHRPVPRAPPLHKPHPMG